MKAINGQPLRRGSQPRTGETAAIRGNPLDSPDNEMKFAQLLLFHQSETRILEAGQSGQGKQREQVERCDLVTNRFAQL